MDALHEDAAIGRLLDAWVVRSGVAPRAVAGYAQRTALGWDIVGGAAKCSSLTGVFDLASVSKPFTALCAAKLVAEGLLSWQSRLSDLLPLTQGTHGGTCTIEELLSHRSGLQAHVQLFRASWAHHPLDRERCLLLAAHARGSHDPKFALYSDLGYLLSGEALSKLTSSPLDHLLHDRVFAPFELRMGSARAFRRADPDFRDRVAATEIQRHRGGLLCGVVHDDNAWALGGTGCSGHAGLFADLTSLLRFGAHFLNDLDDPAKSSALLPLVERRPGGTLRMGFDGITKGASAAGKLAGTDTFGHLGFSGTSLWIDPARARITVLLTNRVFPSRNNPRLQALRPQIHDFLWEC